MLVPNRRAVSNGGNSCHPSIEPRGCHKANLASDKGAQARDQRSSLLLTWWLFRLRQREAAWLFLGVSSCLAVA
jgi:hypothetical protein